MSEPVQLVLPGIFATPWHVEPCAFTFWRNRPDAATDQFTDDQVNRLLDSPLVQEKDRKFVRMVRQYCRASNTNYLDVIDVTDAAQATRDNAWMEAFSKPHPNR